jgi:predicted nucleic acid-binding protein
MTLVDTSIWIDHLRLPNARLEQLLLSESAGLHPFVLGELAAGNLPKRGDTLAHFQKLPQLPIAPEGEVHRLVESARLWGFGLGWVDLHLLAAARISRCGLLTADHAMTAAAVRLGIAY